MHMHMSHMKLIAQNSVVPQQQQPKNSPPASLETFLVGGGDENSGRGRKGATRRGEEEAEESRGDQRASAQSQTARRVEASGIGTTQAVEALLARQTAHALSGQRDNSPKAREHSRAVATEERPLGDLLFRLASRR
jgi:hypothetical protein